MIDLLGIGMPASPPGQWLFRRLCVRVERPELIAVVAQDPDVRLALLDAVTGRRIPPEGRVWLRGHPLMKETLGRYRARVADVDLHAAFVERLSLISNMQLGPVGQLRMLGRWRRRLSTTSRLAAKHALSKAGLERLGNDRMSALPQGLRRRALIAHAVMSKPHVVVVREVERDLSLADAADVLAALRLVVACDHVTVVVSTAEPILVHMFAERVLDIADGQLRFNGPPSVRMSAPTSIPTEPAPESASA
jgi:phosphonate transport system ATP-binding protein